MAGPPISHFSTWPLAFGASTVIIGWGFDQTNSVTVPFTVTSLVRLTGHW
jgi:hypothetical protein